MKVNSTITVTARCRVYDRGDSNNYKDTQDIDLSMDIVTAANFLLRVCPYAFQVDGYKVIFHMDNLTADGLQFVKDDEIFVVTNFAQFMSDIHLGYIKLIMMSKLDDIMEFDFNSLYDDVEDEFESEGGE